MNKGVYNKLTETAKSALSDILAECKDRILDEAYSIAEQNQTEVVEISLSDILSARKKLLSQNSSKDSLNIGIISRAEYKKRFIRLLLTSVIIVYAVVVFLYFLRIHYNVDLHKDHWFTFVTIGAASITYLVMVIKAIELRNKVVESKKHDIEILDKEFLNSWDRIAYFGRLLHGDMINRLLQNKYTEEDKDKIKDVQTYVDLINLSLDPSLQEPFKEVLRIRNKITHGDSGSVTREEKEEAISIANLIVAILKRKVINDIPTASESSIEDYYNKDYHKFIDEFDSDANS